MSISLPDAVLAIGSLGAASFALVDSSKAVRGGVSNLGFGHVEQVLDRLFPPGVDKADRSNALTFAGVLGTLRANWLNGRSLADQKSIAKTLIKLRLDATNAAHLAAATGVDPAVLASLAAKYATGGALSPEEQNVAGRFDLLLTTLLEEGYERADQAYRNGAKAVAGVVAVVLAVLGKLALGDPAIGWGMALLAGFLAAPLAPVSKDLASALQASVKALQIVRT